MKNKRIMLVMLKLLILAILIFAFRKVESAAVYEIEIKPVQEIRLTLRTFRTISCEDIRHRIFIKD